MYGVVAAVVSSCLVEVSPLSVIVLVSEDSNLDRITNLPGKSIIHVLDDRLPEF